VQVYVNKVGPYSNPQETYHYYSLPVCRPQKIVSKELTLGEVLSGDRMAQSLYEITFNENIPNKLLCELLLETKDVQSLEKSIEEFYYFEFVVDDIPCRGFVGQVEETSIIPHTHNIYIIYVNISTKERTPTLLKDDGTSVSKLEYSYSAKWHETDTPYKLRAKYLSTTGFFPETLESRILKHDFNHVNDDDNPEGDNGWKIIHTDVFRFPNQRALFCSVLGE
ncbi:unnamed protein product, partial [Didymodactylos carnosus]